MTPHPAADLALALFALVCIIALLLWTAFGPQPRNPA